MKIFDGFFDDRTSKISKSKPNAQWKAVEKNKNTSVFLVNFLNFVFLSPEELQRPRKLPNTATGYGYDNCLFEKSRVSVHSLILRH